MLLREKLMIWALFVLCVVGILDLNTPWGNRVWEKTIGFPGRFLVQQGNKFGYVNGRSRLIIPIQFSEGTRFFKEGPSPAAINGQWGFIDSQGQWVVAPQYFSAGEFSEGLAAVSVRSSTSQIALKFGFIDPSGAVVIPLQYAQANAFSEGLAAVKEGGLWGFIDERGQRVIEPQFEEALNFSQDLAGVKTNGRWGFIGRNGLFQIPAKFDELKPFSDHRAPVKAGVRWGLIDRYGNWVVQPQWLKASAFSEGLAAVDRGYIDPQGNVVIPSRGFIKMRDFSEGLAAVEVSSKDKHKSSQWGYVDHAGRFVIEPRFQLAWDFKGHLARISKDKNNIQRGYLQKNGRLVWDPVDWEKSSDLKRSIKTVITILIFVFGSYSLFFFRNRNKYSYYVRTIS